MKEWEGVRGGVYLPPREISYVFVFLFTASLVTAVIVRLYYAPVFPKPEGLENLSTYVSPPHT